MTFDGKLIANNIRAERNRANLSQEEVAKQLNISVKTYSKYEKDAKVIKAKTLYNLSKVFNCKLDAFYIV